MQRIEVLCALSAVILFTLVTATTASPGGPGGACCRPVEGCSIETESSCGDGGGLFFGDDTSCAQVTCPDSGACCLPAGFCAEVFESDCPGLGGFYQGDDSECGSFGPQSVFCFTEACCFLDGTCSDLFPEACSAQGGFPQGDSSNCGTDGFCPAIGACCFADASCSVLESFSCVSAGGLFVEPQVDCAAVMCEPFGACCTGKGCNGQTTEAQCASDQGAYGGDGSTCQDVDCLTVGACCLLDGSCANLFMEGCASVGGSFRGEGVFCDQATCTGQCCLPGGACETTTVIACLAVGGSFQSFGTACESSECQLFQPPGETPSDDPNFVGDDGELNLPVGGSGDGPTTGGRDVATAQKGDSAERTGQVQVFINGGTSGGGQWNGLMPLSPVGVGRDPTDLAVGRIDEDDFADIAVTNRGDDTVSILLNTGDLLGTVAPGPVITGLNAPVAVAIGDFLTDANGTPDLIVANEGDNTAVILQGTGAGMFEPSGFVINLPLGPTAVDPIDTDNDKDFDFAILEGGPIPGGPIKGDGPQTPGRVQFFRRLPSGFYAPPQLLPVGVNPVDQAFGDFDGDGGMDIVTANRGSNSVSILLSNGLTFEPSFEVAVGIEPESVATNDFDGDGDVDIAVTVNDSPKGPAVQVLLNTSSADGGLFTMGDTIPLGAGIQPRVVWSFDADGNGAPDLITGNEGGTTTAGSLSTLLNGVAIPELIDCNGNGIADQCDIENGAPDCNGNGVLDECETAVDDDPAVSVAVDDCGDAQFACPGFDYLVDTTGATQDADDITCGVRFGVFDAWYRYRPAWTGSLFVSVFGAPYQPVMSIYDGCPDAGGAPIACNDINPFGISIPVERDREYRIRIAGRAFDTGIYEMHLQGPDCMLSLNDRNGNGIPDDCECFADVNGDGVVDQQDLLLVMVSFGPCPPAPAACPADVDGSGTVNALDMREVLLNIGPCPEPIGPGPSMGPSICN